MPPDQLQFPSTMTDLISGAWMVSGASVLQNGATTKNGYACDLDKLEEGSRLGIMRKSGGHCISLSMERTVVQLLQMCHQVQNFHNYTWNN